MDFIRDGKWHRLLTHNSTTWVEDSRNATVEDVVEAVRQNPALRETLEKELGAETPASQNAR